VLRWNVETTFEEMRAHLGLETQRQWSDLAIARTTPVLFALFSMIVLGKLERWNAVVNGSPGEAAFLVVPRRDDFIAMGLFSMRPEDNLLTWSHT